MKTEEKIKRFLKRKSVIEVIGENYMLTDLQYNRLYIVFDTFESMRPHEEKFTTIANFIKYDLNNYKGRLTRIHKLKSISRSLYSCVLRYGKAEGLEIYNTFRNKAKKTVFKSCREYWEERGYTDEVEIQRNIREHQDCARSYSAKKLKGQKNTCRSIEYWLNKGYSLEEAQAEVCRVQGRSLSYFIGKYGEVDGTLRYNLRIDKYNNSWAKKSEGEMDLIIRKRNIFNQESYILRGFTPEEAKVLADKAIVSSTNVNSKISQKFFSDLEQLLAVNGLDCTIFYYDKNREYAINGKRVDFYHKKSKVVIEFYGDYWHGNPNKYKPTDSIRKLLVKDKWANDEKRISSIKESNSVNEVIIVWEGDVRTQYDYELERCLNAIKNRR